MHNDVLSATLIVWPVKQQSMTEYRELSDCFDTLRDDRLRELGIENENWRQIIAARLIIERIGERDANYWWDSQVLSSFGGDALGEVVPQTSARAQISLATKIGNTVETEIIESDDTISLFNLGSSVESRIQRAVESIEGNGNLDMLESLSIEVAEPGWSNPLTDAEALTDSGIGTTYELGSINVETLQDEDVLDDVVSQLIAGYGAATKHELVVPYYTVES